MVAPMNEAMTDSSDYKLADFSFILAHLKNASWK
jgi:hypothetical protein